MKDSNMDKTKKVGVVLAGAAVGAAAAAVMLDKDNREAVVEGVRKLADASGDKLEKVQDKVESLKDGGKSSSHKSQAKKN